MNGFDASTYGDSFADVYDEWYEDVSDADATRVFVGAFGENQRVLELGVGTGRLADALAAAGHAVIGVDASLAMLERFRESQARAIGADMAELSFRSGAFDTVLVATNTFFNLTSERLQRRCLAECRRCLRLGGRLILETYVPGDPNPALDSMVTTTSRDPGHIVLTATVRDAAAQVVTGQHIELADNGIRLRPWQIRYATPTELDDLADAAGLRLGNRFADWGRAPFDDTSDNHVSVYVAV